MHSSISVKMKAGICTAFAALLAFSVCASSVIAAEAEKGAGVPTAEESPIPGPAGVAEAERKEREQTEWLASPAAVEQRERSKTAYAELSVSEARSLVGVAFAEEIAMLDAEAARYVSDLKVEKLLGDFGVLVQTPAGDGAIVESSMPLASTVGGDGRAEAVDLLLERDGSAFVPAHPVTEVRLPGNSAGGIHLLDEEVAVRMPAADAVEAIALGDKSLFYPETLTTTDTLVAPIAAGVEVFEQLRSVESPEQFRYALSLPAGASLRANGSGGAEVVSSEGERIAEVRRPWAVDEQGSEVPVTLGVDGSAIVLAIPHRSQDVAYPILLDPTYVTEFPVFSSWYPHNPWGNYVLSQSSIPGQPQLLAAISKGGGTTYGAGTWAQWEYTPPGSTAYAERAIFESVEYEPHKTAPPCASTEPHGYAAMYNVYSGWQPGGGSPGFVWSGGWSWTPAVDTGSIGGVGTRKVIVAIGSNTNVTMQCAHELKMGGVTVTQRDPENPSVSVSGVPSGWIGPSFGNVTVTASDPGFGISRISIYNGGPTTTNNMGFCNGTVASRCQNEPAGWSVKPPYRDGVRNLQVTAEDPVEHVAEWSKQVKVDFTSPVINLHGELAEATRTTGKQEVPQDRGTGDNDELRFPVYELKVAATDGNSGTPAEENSGVKKLEVELDGEDVLEEALTNSSPCDNCGLSDNAVSIDLTELSTDEVHVVEAFAEDHVGNKETRKIEFEYIPATGMKEEYVLQRFPLDDGVEREAAELEHGPELAVNVMNGNLAYHQRDVNIEGPNVDLEVERFYNSQLPEEENTEWGDGWTLAQTPSIDVEPQEGPEGDESARFVESTGSVLGSVTLPGESSEDRFVPRLHALANAEGEAPPSLTDTETGATTVFDAGGRTTELETAGPAQIDYSYEGGDLAKIEVEDPNSSSLTPEPPPDIGTGSQPEFVDAFSGPGSAAGRIDRPADAATDESENLWVVDQGNHRLQQFDAEGDYADEFGSKGTGNGQLRRPAAVAIDAEGDIWVADAGNRRVQEFEADGDYIGKFGSAGDDPGEFGGGGPEGIAIAADGSVWVADTDNGRLQRFSSAGAFIESTGTSGPGQLTEPVGIDVAPDGSIWVADARLSRLFQFDEEGDYVSQVGSAGSGKGEFSLPTDVDVDGRGRIWVADQGNARVQKLSADGKFIASFGSAGSEDGEFSYPAAVTTGAGGTVFVVDAASRHPQPPPAASPQAAPVAAYPLDENEGAVAHDAAGEHDGTIDGANWTTGKFGSALDFDSAEDDCVSVPDSPELQLLEDFTLEAWVRPEGTVKSDPIFFKEAEGFFSYSVGLGLGSNGKLEAYIGDEGEGYALAVSPSPLSANTWAHVALTYDGSFMRLYLNGSLVDTTGTSQGNVPSTGPMEIGCADAFNEFFNGQIDEVRVYERALAQSEVEEDRASAIETPLSVSPVAAYPLDENEGAVAHDAAGEHDGTIDGANWTTGKFGSALDFDSAEDDCVSVPDSPELQLLEDFTLEAWVRPEGTVKSDPIFFKEAEGFFSYSVGLGLGSNGKLEAYIGDEGEGYALAVSPSPLSANTWAHVALTYDGSFMRLYLNGSLVDTTGTSQGNVPSTGPMEIGCADAFNEFFNGQIDEVRVYERALSQGEIEEEMEAPRPLGGGNRIQKWSDPTYTPDYRYALSGGFGSQGEAAGELNEPADISAAPSGQLWVADAGNDRVQKFNALGQFVSGFGSSGEEEGQLESPSALALDGGELWVVDSGNDRVQVFDESGEPVLVFGETGSGPGELSDPSGIAIGADGNVWIADTGNSRIQVFTPSGSLIDVVGGPGAEAGEFDEPRGLAFDAEGNLWVADTGNDRLQKLDAEGEPIAAFGSQGDGDAEFEAPAAVEIDETGIVWVGDTGNDRVQALDEEGSYLQQVGTPGGENIDLLVPMGMAAAPDGSIWVTDGGYGVIQKIVPPDLGSEEEAEEILEVPNDPAVMVETDEDLVSGLEGPDAEEHSYDHSGDDLVAHDGPAGETRYAYESGRLTEVELPNGTLAEIEYESSYNRVSKVTVDPAGSEPAESTSFSYSTEPRKTVVTLPSSPALHYEFAADGSVLKRWNAAEPPKLTLTGTLAFNKETAETITQGLHNLKVEARGSEPIKRIQIVAHDNTLVSEKICTPEPEDDCEKDSDEWVVETSELPPGVMYVEARAEDTIGQFAGERFWVNVPYSPPPPPEAPLRPTFVEIKQFRAEYGLDLDLNVATEEEQYNDRIYSLINAWNHPNTPEGGVARSAAERWGVPLRAIDVAELEYRDWYLDLNGPLIDAWGFANYPNSYAGYQVDHAAGGLVRVGFTQEQGPRVAELLAGLTTAAEDRITAFTFVPSMSVADHESVEGDVVAAVEGDPTLEGVVTEVGSAEPGGSVLVGATNVATAEARLTLLVGSLAGITVNQQEPWVFEDCTYNKERNRQSGRIFAGDAFFVDRNPGGSLQLACGSAAFGAYKRRLDFGPEGEVAREPHFLTAGHMGSVNTRAYRLANPTNARLNEIRKIGQALGQFKRNTLEGGAERIDAAAVKLNGGGLMPFRRYGRFDALPRIREAGTAQVGDTLCRTGASVRRVTCGPVKGFASYPSFSIKVKYVSTYGDSGGPVWLGGGSQLSIGLHSARMTPSFNSLRLVAPLLTTPYGKDNKAIGALDSALMNDLIIATPLE